MDKRHLIGWKSNNLSYLAYIALFGDRVPQEYPYTQESGGALMAHVLVFGASHFDWDPYAYICNFNNNTMGKLSAMALKIDAYVDCLGVGAPPEYHDTQESSGASMAQVQEMAL